MHTALCSFDSRDAANRAVDRLVQAGFDRSDVHVEHGSAHAEGPTANSRWDGMEREVAVDPHILQSFGRFFASLFGKDNHASHTDTYSKRLGRGSYVVVVDGQNDADAMRAQALLRDLEAGDVNLVPRPGQRPLRDIVSSRGAPAVAGTSGLADDSAVAYDSTQTTAANLERERATASSGGVSSPSKQRDDLTQAPGLRYSDKDKPLG